MKTQAIISLIAVMALFSISSCQKNNGTDNGQNKQNESTISLRLPTDAQSCSTWICEAPFGNEGTTLSITFYPDTKRIETSCYPEQNFYNYLIFSRNQHIWDYQMVDTNIMAYQEIVEPEFPLEEWEESGNFYYLTMLSSNSMKMEYGGIMSTGPGSMGSQFVFVKQENE